MPAATVLALDVSSTAVGWAVGSRAAADLLDLGVLWPTRRSAPAADRIDALVAGVRRLVAAQSGVALVVLEWSGGKVHRRIAGSGGVGLAVLGQAQGQVRQALRDDLGGRPLVLVPENEWTGGCAKERRALRVELIYPAYAAFARRKPGDPGRDAADAVGLLDYWRAQDRTAQLLRAAGAPAVAPPGESSPPLGRSRRRRGSRPSS